MDQTKSEQKTRFLSSVMYNCNSIRATHVVAPEYQDTV
jgi:hypothetical protein